MPAEEGGDELLGFGGGLINLCKWVARIVQPVNTHCANQLISRLPQTRNNYK